jgi:hypothetical protein
VWQQKLKALLKDVYEGVFGCMIARVYLVEFQKRGLTHAHEGEHRLKSLVHDNATLNQWVVTYNPYCSQKYDYCAFHLFWRVSFTNHMIIS